MTRRTKKTAAATTPPAEEPADIVVSRGIGLKRSEWAAIDNYAAKYAMTPHALTMALARFGLRALQAGKFKTVKQEKLVL